MVLPFALVIDVGHYLFLFLSIYTASCYPYLEHVQSSMATASWINDLSIDRGRRLAMTVTVTMPSFAIDDFALRCNVAVDDVDTMESPLSRRLWDPGIHFNVNTMTTMMEACNESNPVDRIDRPPAPMSPIDLTPASTMSTDFLLLDAWLLLSTMLVGINSSSLSDTPTWPIDQVPSVDQVPSLFQYCHPTLSRPTVPNVDS